MSTAKGQDRLAASSNKPTKLDADRLRTDIEAGLKQYGHDVAGSVWLGDVDGPWFAYQSDVSRPTASAVKTFFLIELFDKYREGLDRPLPNAAEFLQDNHPAVSHFDPAVRDEIRRELSTASVRRIGQIMMGKTRVSNAVYNAAANLTTAALGGPETLTAAIHQRDKDFKPVVVRRYMLRDRSMPGDNVATAEAMAAVYQKLAAKKLNGIDEPTMTALHEVLFDKHDERRGDHYFKGGSLSSSPITRVYSGWWQTAHGPVVYAVMVEQPLAGRPENAAADRELRRFSVGLTERVIEAALEGVDGTGK